MQKIVLLRYLTQRYQHVDISKLRYLTQIFRVLPDAKPKICVTPNANLRNSQWNIGGVGAPGVGAGVGHVHFKFFVLISFAFGGQRKPSFQCNMGFTDSKE